MRIAFVTETWRPSVDGVVTRLEATLSQLARLGHQALVVAPRGGEAEWCGAPVVGMPAVGLAGVLAARRGRHPLVASFHQDIALVAARYHLGWLGPVIWAYTRRLQGMADVNLVTSRAAGATLERHGLGTPVLWPYGVDLERFHPSRRSERVRKALTGGAGADVVALYVGRLAPEKDLSRLEELAADPGIHLAVVGDGPLRSAMEHR